MYVYIVKALYDLLIYNRQCSVVIKLMIMMMVIDVDLEILSNGLLIKNSI